MLTIDNISRAETLWFTPRERQILGYLRLARSNRRIAEELGIAVGTVKAHVAGLARRLHCANRGELMLWVFQHSEDLRVGYTRDPYLHPTDCRCGAPCVAMEPTA